MQLRETNTLQSCTGNRRFCLSWSFLCWLAGSSRWCNSVWCTCCPAFSCFSVPLWAPMVLWVSLVFLTGWNESFVSAAVAHWKKDVNVPWRESTPGSREEPHWRWRPIVNLPVFTICSLFSCPPFLPLFTTTLFNALVTLARVYSQLTMDNSLMGRCFKCVNLNRGICLISLWHVLFFHRSAL